MSDPSPPSMSPAEARRQRILARGSERLNRITGSVSVDKDPATSSPPAPAAAPAASATPSATALAAPPSPIVTPSPGATTTPPAATATATDSATATAIATDSATAATRSEPVSKPTPEPSTAQALGPSEIEPTKRVTSSLPPTPPPTRASSNSFLSDQLASSLSSAQSPTRFNAPGVEVMQRQPPEGSAAVRSGAGGFWSVEMQMSVRSTRLMRVLIAMLFAQVVWQGTLSTAMLRIPPVLVLALTQIVLIVLAANLIKRFKRIRALVANDALAQPEVPAHMRALDITALVPGLKDGLTALTSIKTMMTDTWDGVAVFVVATTLLNTYSSGM